ncbi:hypothetical protein Rhe02_49000 [Rhizocola hellebori]|uniref:Lipoprotein n=1 Tax=Rhizocola hellebori TaxID=1392758 RepID=A0A8J3QBX1_9ACTN|nr:hypothetical protein [Rhizocola hellebori]GIH06833.1 hypothetical protein Rhe02_49000 [Rhizocola hellebori]
MIRSLWVMVVLAGLAVAACDEAGSGEADQERLRVMQSEPLLSNAIGAPVAVAGFTEGSLPPRRGRVQAKLFEQNANDAPTTAQLKTLDAMKALRDNGWTVYFVACQPPLKPGDPVPPRDLIGPFPSEEWWAFGAYAYKIKDGVSYYAAANGNGRLKGSAAVDLDLRAPSSKEAGSDLFADRPPALAPGASCLEANGLPAQAAKAGVALELDESAGGTGGHR